MITKLSGVEYAPLPSGYGPELAYPPQYIVVHKTDNATATAAQEAAYAHNRPVKGATSAHFYVDETRVIGSVPLNFRAWAARYNGNLHGWHVEICGKTGTFLNDSQGADYRAALLVARLCQTASIPMHRLTPNEVRSGAAGIAGHDTITAAYPGDNGTHTDPDWNDSQWNTFMTWVRGVPVPPVPVTGVDPMSKLPVLTRGMTGQRVKNAQHLLLSHGVSVGPSGTDGDFGGATESAVRTFQTRRHIGVDGKIGNQTWTHLLDVQ